MILNKKMEFKRFLKKDKNFIKNHLSNKTSFIDYLGNTYFLHKNDSLIKEKKLIGVTSMKYNFIDKNNDIHLEYKNHPKVLSKEWTIYNG